MKKTIIAASIAALVAAPAAFADVTISGQINQEFTNDDGTGDMEANLNADIVVSGSEDLGNGMKATYKIGMILDDNEANAMQEADSDGSSATASVVPTDRTIGLSGDFGSVTVGTFEPYLEGAVAAMEANDASDAVSIESNLGNQTRAEGGMRYVSPSMNGFSFGVEGFAHDASAGDDFDTSAVFAQYSNGGLTVRVVSEDGTDDDIVGIGANYTMGDLTFGVVHQDNDTDSTDTTYAGVSYSMGANTISAAAIVDATSSVGTDGDYTLSFKHAMSKNTAVYVAHKSDDSSSTTDMSVVGVQVKF